MGFVGLLTEDFSLTNFLQWAMAVGQWITSSAWILTAVSLFAVRFALVVFRTTTRIVGHLLQHAGRLGGWLLQRV